MWLHAPGAGGGEQPRTAGVFDGAILAETKQTHEAWEDLCGFTPNWMQPWIMTLRLARPLMSDELLHELESYDPVAEVAGMIDPAKVRGRHPLDIVQYTWSKTMLEGQILTWGGDRVDMANSMESRPAFLDHHLAEFATRIPPTVRIRGNIEKWVLREAMKGVLPEILYKREKFAFMAPPSHEGEANRSAVASLVERWLTDERISEAGLFDPGRVAAFVGSRGEHEAVEARRSDILLNHLIQLHVLHDAYAGSAEGADAGALGSSP